MNSTNSYLSSHAYHSTTNRFSSPQCVQQQLNDLNCTRSSTTSCSTSHCLSHQCLECTTILSTRNLNTFIDQTSTSSHFVQNCSFLPNPTIDNPTTDDPSTTRILSMNIPVENHSSILNIELDDNNQRTVSLSSEQDEQLEVFVGFYRPGEYQREIFEDDDDEDERSEKSETPKKDEQVLRELISDDDDGNEDQDFIEEDFGPNQDDDLEANNVNNPLQVELIDENEQILLVQIDEDEDQGFGAQLNDDCPSSDDENNHRSTLSLHDQHGLLESAKQLLKASQSDNDLTRRYARRRFSSLPNLAFTHLNSFEKIEHFIIDDQQLPLTTISNLMSKKKTNDSADSFGPQTKKALRRSSEEILEISNQEASPPTFVDEAVRDVERRVTLWEDEQARVIDNQSSIEQIVQYFQLNLSIPSNLSSRHSCRRRDSLLDYLQYRSEIDISAHDLHEHLLQFPDYSSNIYSRFFPFWPPRDVDLLQWLSHWIKQGALPVAIMNMDHQQAHSSWQHRLIYGIEPRAISLMNPIQIQSPQQVYEQLTVDSLTFISRQEILQRYHHSPVCLTALAKASRFPDQRWRTMNVLGQVVNVLREDRQLKENETRNIPYRPTVTHVRIPSTCSSGILIFSKDYQQLFSTMELPLRQ